jgi:hypothetical protein
MTAAPDRRQMLEVLRQAFHDGENVSFLAAAALGDSDLAMDAYLAVWDGMRHKSISGAYWQPWLMPYTAVRSHPKFKQLMQKNGLAAYWRKSGHWSDFCHAVGEDDFECE